MLTYEIVIGVYFARRFMISLAKLGEINKNTN